MSRRTAVLKGFIERQVMTRKFSMSFNFKSILATLLVTSMLLSGCLATIDDTEAKQGCTDSLATNFDENAEVDDGSCTYPDTDGDGIFDFDEISGCMDMAADNYNEAATDDDGSCLIPWESEYGVNWVEHEGGEGCECSDGSNWTFWSRDADPAKVILYFQGGGACWEDQSCRRPGGTYKTTVHDDDPSIASVFHEDAYGIGNFRNQANPLADWSWVYVPYCTGDVHIGMQYNDYAYSNVSHSGHTNSQFAYNYMLDNYPDAETILVTGSSAGSIGAPFYAAQTAIDYPDSQIMMFNDGSDGLHTNNTFDFYEIWNLNETMLDFPFSIETLNFNQMDSGDLVIAVHGVDNSVRFGRFSDSDDGTMKMFSSLLGNDITIPYKTKILETEQKIEAAGINISAYMTEGSGHTILLSERFYTLETEGVSFLDWFSAWVEGENVEDVHCTDC